MDINQKYLDKTGVKLTVNNLDKMKVDTKPDGKLLIGITQIENPYITAGTINIGAYNGNPSDNAVVKMEKITTSYTMLNSDGNIDADAMANVASLFNEIKTNSNIADQNIIKAIGEDNQEVKGDEPLAYIKIQQGIGVTVGSDGQTKSQSFSIDYGTISTSISSDLFSNKSAADVLKTVNEKVAQINTVNTAIENSVKNQIKNMNDTLSKEFSKLDTDKVASEMNKVKESLVANFANNLSALTNLRDKIEEISKKSYQNQEDANKALQDAVNSVDAEMSKFQAVNITSEKKVISLGLPAQEKALEEKRNLSFAKFTELKAKYPQLVNIGLGQTDTEKMLLDSTISDSVKLDFLEARYYMEIYSSGNGNETGFLTSYNFSKFVTDNNLTGLFNQMSFTNDVTYDKGTGIKLGTFMKNIAASGQNMRSDLSSWKNAINSGKVGGLDWMVDPKTGKYNSVIYAAEAKKVLYTKNGSFDKNVLVSNLDEIIDKNKAAYSNGTMTSDQKKGYEMMVDMRSRTDKYNSIEDIQLDGKTADLEYLAQTKGIYKSDNLYSNGRPTNTSVMPGYDSVIKTAYTNNTLGPSNVMAMADYLVQDSSAQDIVNKLKANRENGAPIVNSTEGNKSLKLNGVNQSQGITMLNNPIPKTTATIAINSKSITPVNNSGTEVRATVRYTPMEFKEGTGTPEGLPIQTYSVISPQLPTTYTPDYLPLPIIKDGARTYNLQSKTGLNYVKYGYNSEMATTIRAVKPLDNSPDIQFDVFLENQ